MSQKTEPIYVHVARKLNAIERCKASNNNEWTERHTDSLQALVKQFAPSGSGIDSGTTLDLDTSKEDKLVFQADYHHMNDGGYYDGWTEHTVVVTPSLAFGFTLKVTGRDRNEIKDYLAEVFQHFLTMEVYEDTDGWHCPEIERIHAEYKAGVEAGAIV
jgi:hypothetical protein